MEDQGFKTFLARVTAGVITALGNTAPNLTDSEAYTRAVRSAFAAYINTLWLTLLSRDESFSRHLFRNMGSHSPMCILWVMMQIGLDILPQSPPLIPKILSFAWDDRDSIHAMMMAKLDHIDFSEYLTHACLMPDLAQERRRWILSGHRHENFCTIH